MSELFALTMPKWGIEMVEGVVTDWMVEEGQDFAKGEVIMAVETEKIVNDVEAELEGVLLKALAEPGETYAVGTLLGVIGPAATAPDEVERFVAAFKASDGHYQEDAPAESQGETTIVASDQLQGIELANASPRAAQYAAEQGLDLTDKTGSGRHGRLQLQDVQRLVRDTPPATGPAKNNQVDTAKFQDVAATPVAKVAALASGVDLSQLSGSGKDGRIRLRDLPKAQVPGEADGAVPFSSMRKKIAQRLSHAYQTIPHYYLNMDVRMDEVLALRETFNKGRANDEKASINDFVLKACALALVQHPALNVHVGDEVITPFSDVNLSIAVALEDGLVTPVLANANRLPMTDLPKESRRLIGGAQSGKLNFKDYSGGTFTVSNLGMFGVDNFTAIINPPQAAILAVGAVQSKVLAVDGKLRLGSGMTLTLGLDHRVIDGAVGGRFLSDLKGFLESPDALI